MFLSLLHLTYPSPFVLTQLTDTLNINPYYGADDV